MHTDFSFVGIFIWFLEFLYQGSGGQQSLINIEMELRKCCNHPFLLTGVEDREVKFNATWDQRHQLLINSSGKLVFLYKLLKKLRKEGHKGKLFSY